MLLEADRPAAVNTADGPRIGNADPEMHPATGGSGGEPGDAGASTDGHVLALLRDRRSVALLLAATLTILSNSIISPALPGIRSAFAGTSRADLLVPLLVTAPSLLVAIVAPFAGSLADRFGPRRQLLTGVVLFALAGTAGLWLDSLDLLLASRLVLGVAVALIMTAQTAFIGRTFAGRARENFMGLQMAATNLSGFTFMLTAGRLAGTSPFLPFAIYAISLVYLPLMWAALKDPEKSKGGVASTVLGGDGKWLWSLGAAALLAGFTQIGFYLVPTQIPFYLSRIGHTDPATSAMVLASVTLSGGILSLAYGRLHERLGQRSMLIIGFVLFAAGFGVLSVASTELHCIAAGVLVGAATGFLMPTFLSIAVQVAPAGRLGTASGVITTAMFLGQFLSPLASRPLIGALDYGHTFELTAAMFVALGLMSLIFIRGRRSDPAVSVERKGR